MGLFVPMFVYIYVCARRISLTHYRLNHFMGTSIEFDSITSERVWLVDVAVQFTCAEFVVMIDFELRKKCFMGYSNICPFCG